MDFDYTTETITPDSTTLLTIGSTGGLIVPSGTSAQRVGTTVGTIRWNSDDLALEFYNGSWTPLVGGNGASVSASWQFDTSTTASDPGSKKFRLNNATLASVTAIYFNDTANQNFDASTILGFLSSGNRIYIQQKDDATKAALFSVSGAATDNTGWWTVSVTTVSDSSALYGSNKECATVFMLSGAGGTSYDTQPKARVASTGDVSVSSAPASIDGVTLSVDDVVLLKNQGTGSQNGVYNFNGAASALTRNITMDTSAKAVPGMLISVSEGTINNDSLWMLTTNGPITLGVTALVFQTQGTGYDTQPKARAATTADISISSAPASIDGVTLSVNDIILLKNQTAGATNGVYNFNGTASALTRNVTMDSSVKAVPGMLISVSEGSVNNDSLWMLTTNGPITLGTTPLVFQTLGGDTGPGGLTTQVQFNNAGAFGGSANLTVNTGTGALTAAQLLTASAGINLSGATSPLQVGGSAGTANMVLASAGAATTPTWTATPTITGTNFTSIPNGALSNSSVTIGSTAVSLGATVTTFAGLVSVTSTTFVGALTGNADTATSAGSATNATNTAITDDVATAATMYPTWVTANTGNLPQKTTSTKLTFNPSTGMLSSTGFTGALTGNADTATTAGSATNATNIGITDDVATAATMYPLWATANTGNLPAKVTSTKLTFNPSTGMLSSTGFTGALTGSATALKSASTSIDVAAATAPNVGDVLTATSSTAATWQAPAGGATPLSSVSAATGSATINNANYPIAWNWTQTTASQTGFAISETTASTNGAGSQYLVSISTLASSTANPFRVQARGVETIGVSRLGAVSITALNGTLGGSSVGSSVVVNAGAGASTSAGGTIQISGGVGGATSGNGGAVTIASGQADFSSSSGNGGLLALLGGDASGTGSGTGGAVSVKGGPGGATAGTSGAVTISSGDAAAAASGNVSISVTNAAGSGLAGILTLQGGASRTVQSGNSGGIVLNAGNAGTVASVAGGPIVLAAGTGSTTTTGGIGGAISITAGTGGLALGGGNLTLAAGAGGASGTGGYLVLTTASTTAQIERFRILNNGAWSVGTGGTAYGVSGEVLTSTGGTTPPTWQAPPAGALSAITAATGSATINNANYPIRWNWTQTTASQTGFYIGENTASTSGAGAQYLHAIGTLAASTANPFLVQTRAVDTISVSRAGAVTITALNGTAGSGTTGSDITLTSGAGASTSNAGGISLTGGNGGTASATTGGAVTITAGGGGDLGSGIYPGTGGGITLVTGQGDLSSGSISIYTASGNTGGGWGSTGSISISSGTSGPSVGNTGNVSIGVGNQNDFYTSVGIAGILSLTGGSSRAAQVGNSGGIVLTAGNAGTVASVAGGPIVLKAGTGSVTTTGGIGGAISITAGTGGLALGGGNLTLAAGAGGASGTGGYLVFTTAATTAQVERLRILNNGAWSVGTGGAAYGTSGQVLGSTGGTTPPAWTSTPTLTGTNITGVPLSGVSAATGSATLANGNNPIAWNWTQTTASQTGFYISETTASTNGAGSQFLVSIGTLASSTASPFRVLTRGAQTIGVTRTGDVSIAALGGTSGGGTTGSTVTITGGVGASTSAGGTVTMQGGMGGGTSGNGGAVTVQGGNGGLNGSGDGGVTTLSGGYGGTNSGTGAGGNAVVQGGLGGGLSGAGGAIVFNTAPTLSYVERFRILNNGAWSVGTGGAAYGASGEVLTSTGGTTPPTWQAVSASSATNLSGGAAGTIVYQSATGTTAYLATVVAGSVLTSNGAALPVWSTTPTFTGTNITGIPNGGLSNSAVTIGSTSVSLGATVTTFAGLVSVTSTTFVGALTGNADTATSATSAGSATNATNTAITDDTTTAATMYPTWVTANTGNLPQKVTSTKLTFNPSTGMLSSTGFTGALTGNADTATTAGSATNATNTAITDDVATAATMYPTWVTANTGNLPQKTTSTKLTFNPSTGMLSSTGFTGALTGNADTATTATNATNVAITDDTSTAATMYPLWATANTGNLPAKVTSTKLTFNPSTGMLSSTGFTGALTGNADTATSATNATNTGITDDVATAATMYPTWVTANTGNLPQKTTSTKLTFNPSTGMLSSTGFTGALTGSATALKSASTSIDVAAATAPNVGDVLTATSSTAATWQAPAGGTTLNAVTAATGTASRNNGDNYIAWNWAQTAASQTAFTIGENSASTSGAGSQVLMKIGTLAASTADPLQVQARGVDVIRVSRTGDLTLTALIGTTGSGTTGSNIALFGGQGDVNSAGGIATLTSGAGGATTGASGTVTVASGTTTSGSSGIVTVTSGAPTAGASGNVNITVANAGGTNVAGILTLQGGSSGTTQSGNSGGVAILGGAAAAVNSVVGGPVVITGGAGASVSGNNGIGGALTFTGGAGGANTSAGAAGGIVTIIGGPGGLAAAGGAITVQGGTGGATGAGGIANLLAGTRQGTGAGSAVNVTASPGITTGAGGPVNITAGAGVSAVGGNIVMAAGAGSTVGMVNVSAGSFVVGTAAIATTATDGFIYLSTSAGPPTGVPTTRTGAAPIHVDSTNSNVYVYMGGAWTQINGGGSPSYNTNIGDGTNTSYTVTHNLNTTDPVVTIKDVATEYFVYPDIKYSSANAIILEFVDAPTTNQFRVAVR